MSCLHYNCRRDCYEKHHLSGGDRTLQLRGGASFRWRIAIWMRGKGCNDMKKHARTNLSDFARGWSKASVLHQLPLILVDLAYIWYLCIRVDDTAHFLCVTILMVI